MFLANKQDSPNALSPGQVSLAAGLNGGSTVLHRHVCQPCVAIPLLNAAKPSLGVPLDEKHQEATTYAVDWRLMEGIRWLVRLVDADWPILNPRVQRERHDESPSS